ncbi:MAG: phage integrase N-terminal SAM-like domain-containing protein [Stygiobacter sp.]
MKRVDLVDTYMKILHLKNYSLATEKTYLNHLNLFLDYVKTTKVSNVDSKFLLNYFNFIKESKNFSYSSMKQALASVRFLFLDVLRKEVDFDFFIKMKKPNNLPNILTTKEVKNIIIQLYT